MVKRLGRRNAVWVGRHVWRVLKAAPRFLSDGARADVRNAASESEALQSHGDLGVAERAIVPVLGTIQKIPPTSALRLVVEAVGRAGAAVEKMIESSLATHRFPNTSTLALATVLGGGCNSIAAPCASPLRTARKSSSSAVKAVSRLGSHASRPRPTID
ncbi:hypothetical protein BKA80DRAFT_259695 [Phyllosticta citrichinensis]